VALGTNFQPTAGRHFILILPFNYPGQKSFSKLGLNKSQASSLKSNSPVPGGGWPFGTFWQHLLGIGSNIGHLDFILSSKTFNWEHLAITRIRTN